MKTVNDGGGVFSICPFVSLVPSMSSKNIHLNFSCFYSLRAWSGILH